MPTIGQYRWDGPRGLSNKIPRKPQFTAPGGLYGVLLVGNKKHADQGGGSVSVVAVWAHSYRGIGSGFYHKPQLVSLVDL